MRDNAPEAMRAFFTTKRQIQPLTSLSSAISAPAAPCVEGYANPGNGDAPYPCAGIDLQSFLSLSDIGGISSTDHGNDIWGWTAANGHEYAIMGRVFGTSFVDVTDPTNPVYLGNLPTHGAFGSSWRDIKVDGNYAYIVSEAKNHGIQVFDLTQLQDQAVIDAAPNTFIETAHYGGGAAAHNIFINEDSHFAYMVGNSGKNSCSGGLHMVDLADPLNPSFAGCYSTDGYTHDVQCVNYHGPDEQYAGREICFASNEDTVTIVDVTNKSNPTLIAKMGYGNVGYTHQGWLSDDHAHFIWDDELDEYYGYVSTTTTRVADVSDLDNPGNFNPVSGQYEGLTVYASASTSIDHNLYMVGGCAVQANYRSGLRIVDLRDAMGVAPAGVPSRQLGFFDIWPVDDIPDFNGMWSNYAFFPSGNIVASGIEQGLYVLKPSFDLATACAPDVNEAPVVTISAPAPFAVYYQGASVTFLGAAADKEQGVLNIATWVSSLQGEIGTGNTFSTTEMSVGVHEVTATSVEDSAGQTGSASIMVTINSTGPAAKMFIKSLSGSAPIYNSRRYTGEVLVEIDDDAGGDVQSATVSGSWSGAAKGSGSCVTSVTGQCTVSKTGKIGQDMTFEVTGVTHGSLIYDSGLNQDDAFETIPSP